MKNLIIGRGKLAGKGVYAARNFKKGELVDDDWGLKELTQAEFDALPQSEHMFVHSYKGKMYIFPEPSRYTNHSPIPNTQADFEKRCDYATRDIKKGEMITTNATIEVRYELESFVAAYENVQVSNFEWVSGGYRNAVVKYSLPDTKTKKLVLQRIRGNWHILNRQA